MEQIDTHYQIKMETMQATAYNVARGVEDGTLDILGLTRDDMNLVMTPRLWLSSERNQVRRTLDMLAFGSLDLMGLPRINAPAEYIAAMISCYVHPTNAQIACRWYEGASPAEQLAGAGSFAETLTADQLFALYSGFHRNVACGFAHEALAKKVGVQIRQAKPDPEKGDTK